jgi:hypothetical protein
MYKVRVIQLASILGLALFVVSSCILVSESDASGNSVEQNGVTYELTESGGGDYATVLAVDSNLTTVDIPASISVSGKSYEVRSINANVFQNNACDKCRSWSKF